MVLEDDRLSFKPWFSGRVFYMPGRSLRGLAISFKPEASLAVGILERITDIMASRGVPILLLKTSVSPEVSEMMMIVDLTDVDVNVNELVSEIKEIFMVEKVKVLKPIVDGVLVDYMHFPPMIMGERALLLREPVLDAFIRQGYEKFGMAYAVMLYHIGFNIGLTGLKVNMKMVGGDRAKAVKLSEALFKHAGYGILKTNLNLETGLGRAIVYHSFECDLFRGAGKPSSHFIRGILAGWLKALMGRDLRVNELKCIAAGDPYCEFKTEE